MLVGPRVRDNVHGYHLVMPLTRPRGSRILVDRGFVTRDQFNAARRGEPNEEVSVVGLLRTQPKKNSFTPDNSPEKGEWFWIDLDTMAAHSGGDSKDVQPILIEEIFGRCSPPQFYVIRALSIYFTRG
jgi:surfeit locus 1 family protein